MATPCPQCGHLPQPEAVSYTGYEPALTPHGEWPDPPPARAISTKWIRPLTEVLADEHHTRHTAPPPITQPADEFPLWGVDDELHTRLRHLLSVVLEVLNHQRPANRLRNMLAPRMVESLCTRARHASGTHRLRTLHASRPAAGVVEACATVRVTRRTGHPYVLAIAARLEQQHGEWICTTLRPLDTTR